MTFGEGGVLQVAAFDLAGFRRDMTCPSKEICQSFGNPNEPARNASILTRITHRTRHFVRGALTVENEFADVSIFCGSTTLRFCPLEHLYYVHSKSVFTFYAY